MHSHTHTHTHTHYFNDHTLFMNLCTQTSYHQLFIYTARLCFISPIPCFFHVGKHCDYSVLELCFPHQIPKLCDLSRKTINLEVFHLSSDK